MKSHTIYTRAFQIGKPFLYFPNSLIQAFLDFIFPPLCLVCENRFEQGKWLCPHCWEEIHNSAKPGLYFSGLDFEFSTEKTFFNGIYVFWDFSPSLEICIHQIKYHGMKQLGARFGEQIGLFLTTCGFTFKDWDILMPIPLHRVRQRERGYNQSEWIAKGISRIGKISFRNDWVIRKRATKTQTALSKRERLDNVKDAFALRKRIPVKGKSILLVDDVVTTGATMNACAKVLKENGADSVVGIALARPLLDFGK